MPISSISRVHSAYSLSEGAIKIKELVDLCRRRSMPAVAMTDTGNLFGALEFCAAAAEAGVQPIIGCQIWVRYEAEGDAPAKAPDPDAAGAAGPERERLRQPDDADQRRLPGDAAGRDAAGAARRVRCERTRRADRADRRRSGRGRRACCSTASTPAAEAMPQALAAAPSPAGSMSSCSATACPSRGSASRRR